LIVLCIEKTGRINKNQYKKDTVSLINILIITKENGRIKELLARLRRSGYNCSVWADMETVGGKTDKSLDLVLVDIDDSPDIHQALEFSSKAALTRKPMLVLLVPVATLNEIDKLDRIDDFITKPYDINELAIRINRLVKRARKIDAAKLIKCGDLVIDAASCEVVLSGRLIELTFKEYELLRFLAANKGQVFTREALLNKVWKYDYLGGERTVDVHIRRLRSKIEDAEHTFIDTVRNIGYRFRKDS
jgi:DNA-binding response OmpR family regulator